MYHKVITPNAASKAATAAVKTRFQEFRSLGTILVILGLVLVGITLLLFHPALLTIPLSLAITPVVDSKAVNAPGGSTVHNRSTFNLSFKNFDTFLFGKVKPFFALRTVDGDKIRLHSETEARSYTLKNILMGNVRLHKAHFNVPLQAILPFNHDKFIVNPTIGEDVPDDVGCTVKNFITKWYNFIKPIFVKLSDGHNYGSNEDYVKDIFLAYAYSSWVFSNGSLLASLGAHYSEALDVQLKNGSYVTIDRFWEIIFSKFSEYGLEFRSSRDAIIVSFVTDYTSAESEGNWRRVSFKEYISDYVFDEVPDIQNVRLTNEPQSGWTTLLSNLFAANQILANYSDDIMSNDWDDSSAFYVQTPPASPESDSSNLNLERLWAYQLVCAHFFSNDKVDYIFSAELFRQLIYNYISTVLMASGESVDAWSFTVNGLHYQYDFLSACYFGMFLNTQYGSFDDLSTFGYFSALFSFKNSLKFMDYFTGSKTRPFAVGDVTVDTSSGQVSVVDISQKTWMAKLLQSASRFGSKFENYMAGIFNKRPAYDYHNPMFLGETVDTIYSTETENTGEAQVSPTETAAAMPSLPITSQFRNNSDRYAFEFEADRFGVLISVIYFDIERVYSTTTDREFFDLDRFDYFNPYGQFVGDQPIYKHELVPYEYDNPFGYTGRYMQYKQKYNIASGGFCEFLPGFLFLADKNSPTALTPRFIRSHPVELDRFFQSLTLNSLAGYFHFIIKNTNNCSASRPMAFNPTISL